VRELTKQPREQDAAAGDRNRLTGPIVVAFLEQILEEVRLIRATIRGGRRGALAPGDLAVLERVLPVVNEAVGDASFSVAELLRQPTIADPQLRAGLDRALGTNFTARRQGRLFRRAQGVVAKECVAQRVGDGGRTGATWRVSRVFVGAETHVERKASEREAELVAILQNLEARVAALEAKVD
jgi:hypothetical protein